MFPRFPFCFFRDRDGTENNKAGEECGKGERNASSSSSQNERGGRKGNWSFLLVPLPVPSTPFSPSLAFPSSRKGKKRRREVAYSTAIFTEFEHLTKFLEKQASAILESFVFPNIWSKSLRNVVLGKRIWALHPITKKVKANQL